MSRFEVEAYECGRVEPCGEVRLKVFDWTVDIDSEWLVIFSLDDELVLENVRYPINLSNSQQVLILDLLKMQWPLSLQKCGPRLQDDICIQTMVL